MVAEPSLPVARLYFDEDADARLAEALRQRDYDVETTVDAGLLEASDEEQLAYAVSQQRVLVTHNIRHFPGVHAAWVEAGREHWGIIILSLDNPPLVPGCAGWKRYSMASQLRSCTTACCFSVLNTTLQCELALAGCGALAKL